MIALSASCLLYTSTIPYADAIEYGENTSALFKALWELTDLIRLESDLKKHHRAYLHAVSYTHLDVYKRQVQRAVRHMALTHTNQATREKELKADGTISSERHADYAKRRTVRYRFCRLPSRGAIV